MGAIFFKYPLTQARDLYVIHIKANSIRGETMAGHLQMETVQGIHIIQSAALAMGRLPGCSVSIADTTQCHKFRV